MPKRVRSEGERALRAKHAQALRTERASERRVARQAVEALRQNDPDGFADAAERLANAIRGWEWVFRQIVQQPFQLGDAQMRIAFFQAWTRSKSLRLHSGDDNLVVAALRTIMPPYEGPPLCLYRGASAKTAQKHIYGFSWTADLEIADNIARNKQSHRLRGGGVVLATLAPPAAIVCHVEYLPRLTDEQYKEMAARYRMPVSVAKGIPVEEFNDETEYVVDGRALAGVEIVRRYPNS